MEIHKFLNENNVNKYDDVKKLLKSNNFTVKEDKGNPNLYLVYFKRRDIEYDDLTDLQKECNGLILEKDTNNVVCHCFKKFYKNNDSIHPNFNINECKIYYSDEATLLRFYFYNDEWKIATKKCINANKSKWQSNKSFLSLFYEVYDFFNYKFLEDDSLNKNRNYFFLLSHMENSVVFFNESNTIQHLATFDRTTNEEVNELLIEKKIVNKSILTINLSFDNLMFNIKRSKEDNLEIKFEGFVVENGSFRQKILYDKYVYLRELYGNSNSRFFRFLELRKDMEKFKEYITHFDRHRDLFENYEKDIFLYLCKYIHEMYLSNKVYKTNFDIPVHFKRFIYDIHGKYLENRVPITLTDIVDHFSTLHPKLQNFLYNKYVEIYDNESSLSL